MYEGKSNFKNLKINDIFSNSINKNSTLRFALKRRSRTPMTQEAETNRSNHRDADLLDSQNKKR